MKRLLFLALLVHGVWADPTEKFRQANQFVEQHRYREALLLYQVADQEEPNTPNILWNLGIAAQYCSDWDSALKAWTTLRSLEPENWKVRARLIQVYQGAGQSAERDREISELLSYRQANPGKVDEPKFCREQFQLGQKYVLAYENFDFTGQRRVRYLFVVADADSGKKKFVLSLGSYDFDTDFARESGQIKADQRIYHLDYYADKEHRTYAMVVGDPGYEQTRKWVVEILNNQKKPASSSRHD